MGLERHALGRWAGVWSRFDEKSYKGMLGLHSCALPWFGLRGLAPRT